MTHAESHESPFDLSPMTSNIAKDKVERTKVGRIVLEPDESAFGGREENCPIQLARPASLYDNALAVTGEDLERARITSENGRCYFQSAFQSDSRQELDFRVKGQNSDRNLVMISV